MAVESQHSDVPIAMKLSEPEKGVPEASDKKHSKKRKKRQRGQKAKILVVRPIGEGPRDRPIGKGKVRQLDILRGDPDSTKLPRKTREFLSMMRKFNGDTPKGSAAAPKPASANGESHRELSSAAGQGPAESKTDVREGEKDEEEKSGLSDAKKGKKRKFEGMQPGENFAQFSARLRKESRQMIIKTARSSNHQREKKRAYYEKRKERALRQKRRRQGDFSDSDVEEGGDDHWDEKNSIAHLPSYWQEILHNNGRPISEKRKKRLQRQEDQAVDHVQFGEQAERPPEFSSLPVRRGRKSDV